MNTLTEDDQGPTMPGKAGTGATVQMASSRCFVGLWGTKRAFIPLL